MYKLIGIILCGIFGLILRHFMWIGKSWKSKGMSLVIALVGSGVIGGFIEAWEEDNRPKPESDPLNLSDDDYCGEDVITTGEEAERRYAIWMEY